MRKLRLFMLFFVLLSSLIPVYALDPTNDSASQNSNQEMQSSFIVCIDPGHQAKGDHKSEPVAPGSGQRKARVSSGTAGVATKKAEYVVNLEASMILKQLLEEKGYTVYMLSLIHI